MLQRCSTKIAPWYVIPADRKWVRNAAIGQIVKATLEQMDPQYPKPAWKPSDFEVI
jgi:polyphosphate kinase 2 (PPK2 family)